MRTTVFVEKVGKKKFRATLSQPVVLETEGASQEEALDRLFDLASKRLSSGKVFEMQLPADMRSNPWRAYAGVWKEHPEFDEFVANIAECRRNADRRGSK